MTKEIWVSDKLRHDWDKFIEFAQQQANRLGFGYPRYEAATRGPSKENKYMTRMELEVRAYRRTGNREHLLNAANYAWLESRAPENKKHHWNDKVDSATRGRC